MADDEDEDVVFENSALYEHLKEVGYQEDDVEFSSTQAPLTQTWQEINHDIKSPKDSEKKAEIKNAFSFSWWRNVEEDKVKYKYQVDKIKKKILESKVLDEDDRAFLENWSTTTEDEYNPKKSHSSLPWITKWSCGMALVSYLVHKIFTTSSFTLSWLDMCIGAISLPILIPKAIKHAKSSVQNHQIETRMQTLDTFLKQANDFSICMKKAVRLIQEMELVARGFTLVLSSTPVARLEQSRYQKSQRQCPQLRHNLFHTARDLVFYFRTITSELVETHPLPQDLEGIVSYLAHVPLEEYGPCLTLTQKATKQEFLEVTDNYSLSAIKAIVHLYDLHLSEYMRRLTLECLCSENKDPSLVLTLVQEPLKELARKHKTLQQVYQLHKFTPDTTDHEKKCSSDGNNVEIKQAYNAIHSLNLHLQAAIFRVRELEEKIEPMLQDEKNRQDNFHVAIESQLKSIKADMDSCTECWEEGVIRTKRLAGGNQDNRQKQPVSAKSPPSTAEPVLKIVGVTDPVIEDQVFEAYTDPNEIAEAEWDTDLLLSQEERAKKRRQKQEALRMLTELRSVISVRAIDREEREKKAIERMTGVTPIDCEESNGVNSKSDTENGKEAKQTNHIKSEDGESVDEILNMDSSHGESMDKILKMDLNHGEGVDKILNMDSNHGATCVDSDKERESQIENSQFRQPNKIHVSAEKSLENIGDTLVKETEKWNPVMEQSRIEMLVKSRKDQNIQNRDEMQQKMHNYAGVNPGFTANVAALAAARSHQMALSVDTFGDSDESADEEDGDDD